MDFEVGQDPSQRNGSLYQKVLNLVQTYITTRSSTCQDKASNASESYKVDAKVNKILKILSDSESQDISQQQNKQEQEKKSNDDKQDESYNSLLRNIGFEDPEVGDQKLFKKLFQQDYESPSHGEHPHVFPLKEPSQQQEEAVVKEEDEQKNYYIIKFEQFFNQAIHPNQRITRSQLSKMKKEVQLKELSEETPEVSISKSHDNDNQVATPVGNKTMKGLKRKASAKHRRIAKPNTLAFAKRSGRRRRNLVKKEYEPFLQDCARSPHGRKPASPEMERMLIVWITKILNLGLKITQTEIRKKARQIMSKYYPGCQFAGSKGWMEKFFRRHKAICAVLTERNKSCLNAIDFDSDELSWLENGKLRMPAFKTAQKQHSSASQECRKINLMGYD